ncbi:MAG TPA: ADP-ribosylglycohydrolase family protein [Pirellulales bacterium]|nr:ADP-ribosylglycohydrolase family protein [Pirellulales bacterium]
MPLSQRALVGSLLGMAVGDALGLPYEGLSPRRAARLLGPPTRYRLLFGRGIVWWPDEVGNAYCRRGVVERTMESCPMPARPSLTRS